MDKFRIPKIPISVNKSVRFPVTMVDEVEEAIRGQDCTFSAFVVSAVRWKKVMPDHIFPRFVPERKLPSSVPVLPDWQQQIS